MMLRCLRLFVVAWLALLAGCLEFDAQEITIRHDPKADRIDMLFVYRGLFVESGNGSSDKPVEKALKDLEKVLQNGEFLFWCNWPFGIDPTGDQKPPVAALLAHVDVENGALFTDPKGVLCGYQFVRIREAKAFVEKLNTMLELAAQAGLAAGIDGHRLDGDTRELLREFQRGGEKMLVVEPGRIALQLPCSTKDHRWLKQQFEQRFLDNAPREMGRRVGVAKLRASGEDSTVTNVQQQSVELTGDQLKDSLRQSASFRFFWDNDFTIARSQELTTIGLGTAGDPELRIQKASDGLYHDSLHKALRERGDRIEEGLPDQELDRRFEAFRGRDAVLPAMLAEKRRTSGAEKTGGK